MTYEPEEAVDSIDAGSLLRVRVTPDADESAVEGFDEWRGRYEVRVSEPAEDGQANRELERVLSEVLDADVRLEGGATSREKSVAVALEPDELLKRLERR